MLRSVEAYRASKGVVIHLYSPRLNCVLARVNMKPFGLCSTTVALLSRERGINCLKAPHITQMPTADILILPDVTYPESCYAHSSLSNFPPITSHLRRLVLNLDHSAQA